MANLIAIDWDSHELRAVAGRTASGTLTVTDTATMPLNGGDDAGVVATALTELLGKLGVGKGKYKLLVAIGRGKAELRQLTLPPVPENELPGMVRFQAMQSFSTSGDTVAVDYLPVEVSETSTSVIAAGVAPATMKQIDEISEAVSLDLKRVVLRPVAAAALFSMKGAGNIEAEGDCVLVDLLADDAEIVVFRKGKLIFVRSVRMPEQTQGRTSQIAGEIRRSLMACGTDAATGVQRVVIWGQAKTHQADTQQLRDLLRCEVQTLDPLELVEVDSKRAAAGGAEYAAGVHTGRLAPLIGVLVADVAAEATEQQSAVLVDFLNPRKAVEVQNDNRMWIGVGAAAAIVLVLLGVSAWWSLSSKTAEIAARQAELSELGPLVAQAEDSISRTEQVDQFLDAGVVWLDQFRRLAERMPSSDQVILKSVKATAAPRGGGGQLNLTVAATTPTAVVEMESSLRDEEHSVTGSGARDTGRNETYRWGFSQILTIAADAIRRERYEAYARAFSENEDALSEDEETVGEDEIAFGGDDAVATDPVPDQDDTSSQQTAGLPAFEFSGDPQPSNAAEPPADELPSDESRVGELEPSTEPSQLSAEPSQPSTGESEDAAVDSPTTDIDEIDEETTR